MAPVQGSLPLRHRGRVVWILAGEASGDAIGARLMLALHKRDPTLVFAGVGGSRMEALGLCSLFPMTDLSVMGLAEVLPQLRKLSQRMLEAEHDIALRHPDVVVTIDSPGFSLRLLDRIAPLGVRRVHYVAPQFWAWQERRLRQYREVWDRLLCLFPFEKKWFEKRQVSDVRFTGHPVLEAGIKQGNAERFRRKHRFNPNAPVVIMMAGSRKGEIKRLLPLFRLASLRIRDKVPDVRIVLPVTPEQAHFVRRMVREWQVEPAVITGSAEKHDAFAAASCALTKSGTSTLELALAGVPMVVAYRVNPLSALFARHLIKVPFVAMINIMARRTVVPELLQGQCTPENLANNALRLMMDPAAAQAQRDGYAEVLTQLEAPGNMTPADAAADQILNIMDTPLRQLRPDLKLPPENSPERTGNLVSDQVPDDGTVSDPPSPHP
ncbi:lipid-A-disaccharide synthase [Formicincola oecophyllae]|nr:lipid-A-disaccharide synthase [Formicincola oecophyllae]